MEVKDVRPLQLARDEVDCLAPALSLTRRGFVRTSLGAGFAAAVLPVQAQTMITTDTRGLVAGEVKIPTGDGEMPAYRAMPAGRSNLDVLLVVQEIFGVNEHIKGKQLVGGLQVIRNYANAAKKIGGEAVYEWYDSGSGRVTLKVEKGGAEIWAVVDCNGSGYYRLELVEKSLMDQDVVADANSMANTIKTTGKVAVYGIYFDTGKSELKPESLNTLVEISKMLKADPSLKLYVVGHTDNVGTFDSNIKLSMERASAVINELVTKHSINAANLKPFGNGPCAPVATNGTDEGKALNRPRAADLTRQMLAYSGKGRFVIKNLELNELVEENAHLLRASISKTAVLNLRLDPDLPAIEADAGQVQQVVMNLITNASEAIADKAGVITITTGVQDCDARCLKRSRIDDAPEPGRFVFLEVSDNGCGMDEQTQQQLFDPFFKTKAMGRGLGMSAILGIVRGHRGAIFVDSASGRG